MGKRGEIDYKAQEVEGGWQAQLVVHCLPNAMRSAVFAGPVCNSEKEAIHGAATIGLQSIMADPQLKSLHDAGCRTARRAAGLPVGNKEKRRQTTDRYGNPEGSLEPLLPPLPLTGLMDGTVDGLQATESIPGSVSISYGMD